MTRSVTAKPISGTTTIATRSTSVIVSTGMLKMIAATSLPAASVAMTKTSSAATPSAVRNGLSRGRSSSSCEPRSWVTKRCSMNGQSVMSVKATPGNRTPGMNGEGIVTPSTVNSMGGKSRSRPSSQPRYQSGCAGAETVLGMNGP